MMVSDETIKEEQMKKFLSLTLVALMVVSMLLLCSCGVKNNDTSTNSGNDTGTSTSTDTGSSNGTQEALPDDANDNTSFDNVVEF